MQTAFTAKTIAVTGASGSLGQALLRQLHRQGAKVVALTSGEGAIAIDTETGQLPLETITWQVGKEQALAQRLAQVDILVLNHGVNVMGNRDGAAIERSYEVNAFSSWRLLEIFLAGVQPDQAAAREVWVNTSEAESNPAFSPLYELSKRTLGDLVTLRRLDAPCLIRKLVLGPFKSALNPFGILSADWVAQQVLKQATRGQRNILVTINPLTFVTFPLKEACVSAYFRLFTRPCPAGQEPPGDALTSASGGSEVN